jgi:hypothetical protein
MRSSEGSSRSHNLRSQKRGNKWYGRTDLVTFEVFKREYWPRVSQNGICVFSAPSSFTRTYFLLESAIPGIRRFPWYYHWQSRINAAFKFHLTGTIKGSEKSLDYSNRALDREAYENLRNTNGLDYSQFEAYQNHKLKRGERDLADR